MSMLQRSVIAACTAVSVVILLFWIGQSSTSTPTPSLFRSSSFRCQSDHLSLLRRAVNPKSPTFPILNLHQLTFISNTVRGSLSSSPSWRSHNFLVYGLGYDSIIWQNANCGSDLLSHTMFVEDAVEQRDKIMKEHPYLDVVNATYPTLVENVDNDLDSLSNLPERPPQIATTCWDVILVDAPLGYDHSHPGRVIPSAWTLEGARQCLLNGHRDVVYVFLHDVERPAETKMMDRIFNSNGIQIGRINQPRGDLAAWMLTRETLAK